MLYTACRGVVSSMTSNTSTIQRSRRCCNEMGSPFRPLSALKADEQETVLLGMRHRTTRLRLGMPEGKRQHRKCIVKKIVMYIAIASFPAFHTGVEPGNEVIAVHLLVLEPDRHTQRRLVQDYTLHVHDCIKFDTCNEESTDIQGHVHVQGSHYLR